jgi:hypothetical protein
VYLRGAQEAMKRRMTARRIEERVEKELARQPRPKRAFKTYFILGQLTEKIKIGKSFAPQARLADLQVGSPDVLILLAVIDGDQERKFHKKFAYAHSHGEWYYSPDILAFLKKKFNQFIQ